MLHPAIASCHAVSAPSAEQMQEFILYGLQPFRRWAGDTSCLWGLGLGALHPARPAQVFCQSLQCFMPYMFMAHSCKCGTTTQQFGKSWEKLCRSPLVPFLTSQPRDCQVLTAFVPWPGTKGARCGYLELGRVCHCPGSNGYPAGHATMSCATAAFLCATAHWFQYHSYPYFTFCSKTCLHWHWMHTVNVVEGKGAP